MPVSSTSLARLLIVEPDPMSARLLRATFASEPYEIEVAVSGAEALQKIASSPPEVVLLELGLPDMAGADLVVSLKASPSTRDIVVIIVTGKNGHEAEAAARRAGAAGYVRKPIDPVTFPELVDSTRKIVR